MDTKLTGRWGEALAAEYLRKKGYRIVGAGYTTRMGEVDLIAENRKYIAFVEVKTRRSADFAEAKEYVDSRKRRRILAAAKLWLSENDTDRQPRFDVAEIYAPEGVRTKKPVVRYIEDAFGDE